MAYRSTKTYGHEQGLSCVFRQWRADSHCNLLHGYAIGVKIVFEALVLDHRNWVIDFGALKPIKAMLQNNFDHTLLVAKDDPELEFIKDLEARGLANIILVDNVGCEAFSELIYWRIKDWLLANGHAPRVSLVSVEVAEHGANSAVYTGAL